MEEKKREKKTCNNRFLDRMLSGDCLWVAGIVVVESIE